MSKAEEIASLKEEIEREFYRSMKRCACCQRPGEWKTKCGRCKVAYYCSRDCQKWHWSCHKESCVPFGSAPPPARRPAPEARPRAAAELDDDDAAAADGAFDMTDDQLRVSYLEGCGDVDAAVAHLRARAEAFGLPLRRALAMGRGGRLCLLELPGGAPIPLDDAVEGHARPALLELRAANPRCALAVGAPPGRRARVVPPLTARPPSFPDLVLDAAIPTAFVCFAGLGEALVTALADAALLDALAGDGPTSTLAAYDGDDGLPVPCDGMADAVLVFFSGLHDALPQLPKLYASVHGHCRNNIVASAVAKKALFYTLEAEDRYRSPVDQREILLNSRRVPIDTAHLFKSTTLRDLAAFTEADVAALFQCPVDPLS